MENFAVYFDPLQCFLVPFAPDRVHYAVEFDGNLSDGDCPEFKANVKAFTEHLFDPKNILIEKVFSKEVTGKDLSSAMEETFCLLQNEIG